MGAAPVAPAASDQPLAGRGAVRTPGSASSVAAARGARGARRSGRAPPAAPAGRARFPGPRGTPGSALAASSPGHTVVADGSADRLAAGTSVGMAEAQSSGGGPTGPAGWGGAGGMGPSSRHDGGRTGR